MASSPEISAALAKIEQHNGDKAPLYEQLLSKIKELSSPTDAAKDLVAIVQSFFGQSLGIVATRSVLSKFVDTLRGLANDDLCIEVGNRTVSIITEQASAFPDTVGAILELVASAHESNEDFVEAARALAEIPLDSSQRQLTVKQRVGIWIRIVRNYLEVGDSTSAETYINKLKNVMHQVAETETELTLHFNLSQARILDAKRDFLHAANKYHELSFSAAIAEEERIHTLSMAAKCAILAPAGPMRSRTLGKLYSDERSAQLPEVGIMEKIFLDRLLSPEEVEKFAEGLQPHQLATTSDGSTVLAKAMVEHNLLAISKLYRNIDFENLGSRIGLNADKAESTTGRMIEQGRLSGTIDQIEGRVYFDHKAEASSERGSGRVEAHGGREIRRWDANVESVAEDVENITTALHQEFPKFVDANLVT
jgi:COP9 signalosome complex subunit 4